MKPLDPEEKIFSLNDIACLFRQQRKKMCQAALLCSTLAIFYCLIQPVKYRAEATFKECAEKRESEGLLGALGSFGVSLDASPQAAALMKSNLVLKPLVSEFGLQITSSLPHKLFRIQKRLRENLRIARGAPLEDSDPFRFSDVVYEGERSKSFQIRFSSPCAFTVLCAGKESQARLGDFVELGDEIAFRLMSVPESLRMETEYSFSVSPWIKAVEGLREALQIAQDKINRSICTLFFSHRDRHLASELLNALMTEYRRYLKSEHDSIAEAQLAFLAERQNDLYRMLQQTMDEHMDYLRSSFTEGGALSLEDEMRLFCDPHAALCKNAFNTDFALELLAHSLESNTESEDLIDQNLKELNQEIFAMESQRDLLRASLALSKQEKSPFEKEEKPFDLEKIRMDLRQARMALANLENGELPFFLDLRLDPNRIVQSWAKQIAEGGGQKGDLEIYLRNLVRLYSVQEKILFEQQFQERLFPEFDDLDLDAAKNLLASAREELDESRAMSEKYCHFSKKLEDPGFEIATLNAVFHDAVSKNLLKRSAVLRFALSDEENYSGKEEERYLRERVLLRDLLSQHLQQMGEMEEMLISLCQDKIAALQQVSVDKMQHQISVNQEKIGELIEEKKKTLKIRKDLLEKKMSELRSQMAKTLPEKWRAEQLLKFKAEVGTKMMESIGQLVESKTIGHHLHHVESKPLDSSLTPVFPQKPKFALLITAGAFLGAFGFFFLSFFRKLYKGFPATVGTLQALHYPVLGTISFAADGPSLEPTDADDLETLRKGILAIGQPHEGKILLLHGSKGPNYSYTLANLLAQSGRRVLLIHCDFSSPFQESPRPGLLQVLEGSIESLPICQERGYSLLPSGGYTRFGMEQIASPKFGQLLKDLSASYDHLLLYSRTETLSAESETLLRLSDKALVTITGESIEMLTPLLQRSYHEGRTRILFLVSSRL